MSYAAKPSSLMWYKRSPRWRTSARASGRAALLAALAIMRCAGSYDVAAPRRPRAPAPVSKRSADADRDATATVLALRPSTGLARIYDGRTPTQLLSMLQRKVLGHLSRAVERSSGWSLQNDASANALARDLCRAKPEGAPPRQLYEFAMRAHGMIDPAPRVLSFDVPDGHDALLNPRITRGLDRVLGREAFRRVGIASCSSPKIHGRRLLIALLKGLVRISPLPRRLALGQRVALRARLAEPRGGLSLLVTAPGGAVTSQAVQRGNNAISGELACAQRGTYQVELLGSGPHGPEVLMNFPLYCDGAPPSSVTIRYHQRPLGEPPAIEAELLAQTNAFRRARGIPPLQPNPVLARVARRHSLDMSRSGFIGHNSADHGGPDDRVRRASIPYRVLRENIATTYRVDDVIPALAASPGHRRTLQARDVTQIGIGVVVDRSSDPPALYVTQDLIGPASAAPPATAAPTAGDAPGAATPTSLLGSRYTDLSQACRPAEPTRRSAPNRTLTCPGPAGYRAEVRLAGTRALLTVLGGSGFSLSLPPQGGDLLHGTLEWRVANGRPFAVIVPIFNYDDTGFAQRRDDSGALHVRGLQQHRSLNARVGIGDSAAARRQARALADRHYRAAAED